MNTIQPVKFSGYRTTPSGDARLFLPGYASAGQVQAEIVTPEGHRESFRMKHRGNYWTMDEEIEKGAAYRFVVDGQPVLDLIERRDLAKPDGSKKQKPQLYNVISPYDTPVKSGPMLDIFSDSMLSGDQLSPFLIDGDPLAQRSRRDHFNRYFGNEEGLKTLFEKIDRKNAFRSILFKPFIGADNLSSHHYWTIDPYMLNDTFSSKEAMRNFMRMALKRDMKIFADGAFVNQGLNGIQVLSNLRHGYASPYWNWFIYPEHDPGSPYPGLMRDHKMVFGVLPVKFEPETQVAEIDFDRVKFNIVKDAASKDDEASPTYLVMSDPTRGPNDTLGASQFTDSVQPYRFPVDPQEVAKKREKLAELKAKLSPEDYTLAEKKEFLDWQFFRLQLPPMDNSAIKWNGQIDVAKMNMENPEVQAYIRDAMVYWSRFVMNGYIEDVGQALSQARANLPTGNWQKWLDAVEAESPDDPNPLHVLPKGRMDVDGFTLEDAARALENAPKPYETTRGEHLARGIEEQYPLSALPLPETFKATLSHPELNGHLYHTRGPLRRVLGWVLSPVLWAVERIDPLRPFAGMVTRFLDGDTFAVKLGQKLDTVIEKLDQPSQEKLRHPQIQKLVFEALAEDAFLQIFTDQHASDPKACADGFESTVRPDIRLADPVSALGLLPDFAKGRLKELDTEALAKTLKNKLKGLDPEAVIVAEAVLKRREYGLNWRIDAAKDIGDIDKVLNADGEEKLAFFQEQIGVARRFWASVSDKIQRIFPKTAIIAELTDFGKLSDNNQEAAKAAYRKFFDTNIFTSTPNMDYQFSSPLELVNFAPRPDEFGARQTAPGGYWGAIEAMTTNVPWPTALQYQNMTTSHDYSTTTHRLLYNPEIFTQDHLRWWGILGDFGEAVRELKDKACFDDERTAIFEAGVKNPHDTLDKLKTLAESDRVKNALSQNVRNYLTQAAKESTGNNEPTPMLVKRRFVEELFTILKPADLGIPRAGFDELRKALLARIQEPGETRAMRGILTNALEEMDWAALKGRVGQPADAGLPGDAIKTAFYASLNERAALMGRNFGYLPLEHTVSDVVDGMTGNWEKQLPKGVDAKAFRVALKNQLFDTGIEPVFEKIQRIVALHTALPGNPSVYLPDLLAQSGGEFIKNMFLQNRNLVRHDWIDSREDIRGNLDALLDILRLRTDYPVLNDGFVLKPEVKDEDGVVPIIRDNGVDQAIMLVNTGKPKELDFNNKVGDGRKYQEVELAQPVKQDYRLSLKNLDIAGGTRYEDPATGETFRVNGDQVLESEARPGQGIDVATYRMLVRLDRGKTS